MSTKFPGGIISKTAPDLTKSQSGLWTVDQALQNTKAGVWQTDYRISNSLRFRNDSNAYLYRIPQSTTSTTTWTWSGWVKRSNLSAFNQIFSIDRSAGSQGFDLFFRSSDNALRCSHYNGSSYDFDYVTTYFFRDTCAWYHIVVAVDTTLVASADRVKIYVNGVRQTSFQTFSVPSQNLVTHANTTSKPYEIGAAQSASSGSMDGYLTELHFIDGQSLDASYFGVTDPITGAWKPRKYIGSYGTNGSYLNFSNTSKMVDYGLDVQTNTQTYNATVAGNAQISNTQSKFGGTSFYISSNSTDSLEIGPGSFTPSNQDFTVEMWIYMTGNNNARRNIFWGGNAAGSDSTANLFIEVNASNNLRVGCGTSNGTYAFTAGTTSLSLNGWYHIAVVRNKTNVYAYLNGSLEITTACVGAAYINTNNIQFSGRRLSNNFIGYLDDIRMYVGIAKYTSTFTPSATALPLDSTDPYWSYCVVAIPCDGTNGSTTVPVYGRNNWTPYNIFGVQQATDYFSLTPSGNTMDNSPSIAFSAQAVTYWGAGQNPGYTGTVTLTTAIPTTGLTIEVAAIGSGSAITTITLTSSTSTTSSNTWSGGSVTWKTMSAITNIKSITITQSGSGYGGMGLQALRINGVVVHSNVFNDSMYDSPTAYDDGTSYGRGNYSTINGLDRLSGTNFSLSGNLNWGNAIIGSAGSGDGNSSGCRSSLGVTSGKWYVECIKIHQGSNYQVPRFGTNDIVLGSYNAYLSTQAGANALPNAGSLDVGIDYAGNIGAKQGTSGTVGTTASYSFIIGDIIGYALDMDNKTLTVYKNNVQLGSTISWSGFTPGTPLHLFVSTSSSWEKPGWAFNFGQRPFSYTPPSGFNAMTTQNIADSFYSIKRTNKYFDTTLWTGTGASLNISNSNFQPDLVWVKCRNTGSTNNILVDVQRGGSNILISDLTNGNQYSAGNWVTSLNSDGFTVASNSGTGASGSTYVGWQWKAGGTAVSNTDGTITSQVSVNLTSGFSIVTWSGSGSASSTVGHGLGAIPSMIIIKNRTTTKSWPVMHSGLPANGNMFLDLTQLYQTTYADGGIINPATSTTFGFTTTSTLGQVNASLNDYIAYCWRAIPGYSAFGLYAGNSSSTVFVYTGFKPAYVMIKPASANTSPTTGWRIFDNKRNVYNTNGLQKALYSSSSQAEEGQNGVDFLSNGFILANSSGDVNHNRSACTYVYAAFAETPFKYTTAR